MEIPTKEPEVTELEVMEPETPAPKRRGRPQGSKNKAPDVYMALLERMGQLEETFKEARPDTGGTPETPPQPPKLERQPRPPRQPRQPRQPPEPREPPPPPLSTTDQLMEGLRHASEQRRRQQLDFYASFLPQ
jgi:hypothetical protein